MTRGSSERVVRRGAGAFVMAMMALAFGAAREVRGQCIPSQLKRTLNRPFPVSGDLFGKSVAIDGNLAVVGSCCSDPGGVNGAGIAYVFNATTGALVATLNNPAPAANDRFGSAVGISGNVAVVGTHQDDPGGVTDSGSVYVFNATTGALTRTLNNPTPAANDLFGVSVGISGNMVVAGTPRDDPGGVMNSGRAYVFNATTGAVIATLSNPASTADDEFGFATAISGNLAVVGALFDDPGGVVDAGRAYIFNATTGALAATLVNPAATTSDQFGWSAAISGNLAIVGAVNANPGGISGAGSAYAFNATTGTLMATMNNPAPATNDYFGVSVGISGDLAVVGADYDDAGAPDAGTGYIFDATNGALRTTLNNPTPAGADYFSYASAISGDLAVVGAWYDNPGGIADAGTAYIFGCPPNAALAWEHYD